MKLTKILNFKKYFLVGLIFVIIFLTFIHFKEKRILSEFKNSNEEIKKRNIIQNTISRIEPDLSLEDLKIKEKVRITIHKDDRNVVEGKFELQCEWKVSISEGNQITEIWTKYSNDSFKKKLSEDSLKKKAVDYIKIIFSNDNESLKLKDYSEYPDYNRVRMFFSVEKSMLRNNTCSISLHLDGKLETFSINGNLKKMGQKNLVTQSKAIKVSKKSLSKTLFNFKDRFLMFFSNNIKILSLEEFLEINKDKSKEKYLSLLKYPQVIVPDKILDRSMILNNKIRNDFEYLSNPHYIYIVNLFLIIKNEEEKGKIQEFIFYVDAETGEIIGRID